MDSRILQRLEWGVIATAVVVRAAAWFSLAQTRFAGHPLVDASTYFDQARKLAAGKEVFPEGFYQPPGYPFLLSLIQRVTGSESLDIVRGIQLLLGVLTTIMLIRIGRRLGDKAGLAWAGAASGLVYTLYPTPLLFELDLLTPAWTSAAAVGAVGVLMGGLSGRRCLFAGLLLGVAASLHPTYLLAGLAVVAWAWWADRARLLPAVALAAGLLLALAPLTTINLVQYKQLSATSSNAGINFYMGNNVQWRETSFLRPGLRFRKLALESEPHKRDGHARNDYWMDRAWQEIADAPVAWAGTLLTKAHWSLHTTEIPRNEDYRCRTSSGAMAWMDWLPVQYGWIFPLALAGCAVLWPRAPVVKKRRKLVSDPGHGRLIIGLWIAMHIPVILFIVSDRYRLATWPFVALAAPLGAAALFRLIRDRRRPSLLWMVVLAGAVVPWLPIDSRTQMNPGWCAHVSANLAYMDGDMPAAEAGYQEAIDLDETDLDAHNWLARTLSRRGAVDEAVRHVEVILSDFPDHFPTLKFMAGLRKRQGNLDAEADLLLRAYRVPGKRTSTGVKAVKALRAAGRANEARALIDADPEVAQRLR